MAYIASATFWNVGHLMYILNICTTISAKLKEGISNFHNIATYFFCFVQPTSLSIIILNKKGDKTNCK